MRAPWSRTGGLSGRERSWFGLNETVIADPASHELNQWWAAYDFGCTDIKAGRQRLMLDNQRFVGNVGWRQNEHTFDAVTLTHTGIEDLTLLYSYVAGVNRVFGSSLLRALAFRHPISVALAC